jgi:hypothetical protein
MNLGEMGCENIFTALELDPLADPRFSAIEFFNNLAILIVVYWIMKPYSLIGNCHCFNLQPV